MYSLSWKPWLTDLFFQSRALCCSLRRQSCARRAARIDAHWWVRNSLFSVMLEARGHRSKGILENWDVSHSLVTLGVAQTLNSYLPANSKSCFNYIEILSKIQWNSQKVFTFQNTREQQLNSGKFIKFKDMYISNLIYLFVDFGLFVTFCIRVQNKPFIFGLCSQ